MGVVLWQLRERAHQRLMAGQDSAPTRARWSPRPSRPRCWWPTTPTTRCCRRCSPCRCPPTPARAPAPCWASCWTSTPPRTPPTPFPAAQGSVAQVFLLPVAGAGSGQPAPALESARQPARRPTPIPKAPQLAVVNLTGAFAASHPSGIETETLTVLSICGTLHANLPRVAQVRFLVDGKPRATLAGHADLTRTYLAADAVPVEAAHP